MFSLTPTPEFQQDDLDDSIMGSIDLSAYSTRNSTSWVPSLPTMSLGFAIGDHVLPVKLRAAATHGFKAIELFYGCLDHFADSLDSLMPGASYRDRMREASRKTRALCHELDLDIICLQPLMQYDGILDEKEHAERLEEVGFRMELCKLLGTDMIQVPSTFRSDAGVCADKIVPDMKELAELGLKQNPPIRVAFEALCWGSHVYTWQKSWEVVQAVNRPNFGLVLDSFHIAGWEFVDPTVSGCQRKDAQARLDASLQQLIKTVKPEKVFYIQLADAERADPAITPTSGSPFYNPELPPRMAWSRNCRLYPYEEELGAYMPAEQCAKAFKEIGFKGYMSFEIFHRFLYTKDKSVPQESARRAQASWNKLVERLEL